MNDLITQIIKYRVLENTICKSVMISKGSDLHRVIDTDLGINEIRTLVGESLAIDINDLESLILKGLVEIVSE